MSRKRGLPSLDDHVRQQRLLSNGCQAPRRRRDRRARPIHSYVRPPDSQTDFRNRRFASTWSLRRVDLVEQLGARSGCSAEQFFGVASGCRSGFQAVALLRRVGSNDVADCS